jgi:4-hydroxy-tetrahydrodipicolinate reductase
VTTQIAIAGALGRMGRAVSQVVSAREGAEVCALFDRSDQGAVGNNRDHALELADVVIDFTTPQAAADLAHAAAKGGRVAMVIGATGFTPHAEDILRKAAERIAIVKSGNFSLGVNVMLGLVRQAARALPSRQYDIEVAEAHHRGKVDAPSGTALMLGEAAASGRNVKLDDVAVRARDGITGPRVESTIGFSVLRGGGIVGEHSVLFAAEDEILTLSHSARDRSLFARGAVEAALWVVGQPPGLYDMQDVLGFSPLG